VVVTVVICGFDVGGKGDIKIWYLYYRNKKGGYQQTKGRDEGGREAASGELPLYDFP
jgi:hypothetical protein